MTEILFYWLHLPPYPNDLIINTDNKTIRQIVDEIKTLINQEGLTYETYWNTKNRNKATYT